jgi:putative endonuclease
LKPSPKKRPRKKQAKHFVYLLRCADHSLYCGITADLQRRVQQHNGELAGGAKYTRAKRPAKLVYFEVCKNRSKALKREYEIKQMRKKEKEDLVRRSEPRHT